MNIPYGGAGAGAQKNRWVTSDPVHLELFRRKAHLLQRNQNQIILPGPFSVDFSIPETLLSNFFTEHCSGLFSLERTTIFYISLLISFRWKIVYFPTETDKEIDP
jgi:hypothetical protein